MSLEPVPQRRAVNRLGRHHERPRLDLPGEHRPLPRPRGVRRHADPAGDAPRDRGPPEGAEIGVEVRAQGQALAGLHASRDVEARVGPARRHRPQLDRAVGDPGFGPHGPGAERREHAGQVEIAQRQRDAPRASGGLRGDGERAPDAAAEEVGLDVGDAERPVDEGAGQVDVPGAERTRGQVGHRDAGLEARGGHRTLQRRVDPGEPTERYGHPGPLRDGRQRDLAPRGGAHLEGGVGLAQLAGKPDLVALPPKAPGLQPDLARTDDPLGAEPLEALPHAGRLDQKALDAGGEREGIGPGPAVGVDPARLDRPAGLRVPMADAAVHQADHPDADLHRAEGERGGDGQRGQIGGAPARRGGDVELGEGHGHDEPAPPEALEPDADVGMVEPEERAVLRAGSARDGHARHAETGRPRTEAHRADTRRTLERGRQRALELGADEIGPVEAEEDPRRARGGTDEQPGNRQRHQSATNHT